MTMSDSWFDELTKGLTQSKTRRQVLKTFAAA